MLEDLDMAGAVHRLEHEGALVLRLGNEHILAERLPMARGLPQRLVENLGRVDLFVILIEPPPHISDQLLEDRPALWVPEDDARSLLLEVKQVHLAPEPAVVAALRLLELL